MSAPQFRPVWTCFPITEVDEEAIRKNILRVWSNMHWTSVLPMMRQWKQTFFDTNKRRINWNTIMNITESRKELIDMPYSVGFGGNAILDELRYIGAHLSLHVTVVDDTGMVLVVYHPV